MKTVITILLLWTLPVRAQIITEFLAQNSGLTFDEDGDSPDWIELQNPGPQAVNLLNWSLTDSSTNLIKWQFPDTQLAPGAFLVVFASGKDRRTPGEPLHTNFRLDVEGEYLALAAPGGSNIVSAFAPAYAPQLANISYGLSQLSGFVPLLHGTMPVRVQVPASGQLGTDWVAPEFDDSTWVSGNNGVGFENSPAEYAELIQTNLRAQMAANTSCYVRLPFLVENPAGFTGWRLLMQYDDGFIAYLNGQEIARRNAPASAIWNSSATANHPDEQALIPEVFELAPVEDLIHSGTNLLAIHGMNLNLSSSDFLIRAVIEARPLAAATAVPVYFMAPTPGEPNVGGVERLGPLLREAKHAPAIPAGGESLAIQAVVLPAFSPIRAVTLQYRVMFGPEMEAPMFDDGAHQDGAAGDGVYGVVLPPGIAAPGQMIRYYVTASDDSGGASRLPLYLEPLDSEQYFGTIVADASIESRLPVVHWFVQNPAAADTRTGTRGSVFYAGEFYDNVLFSLRGQSSSGFSKKGYNLDFTRDHRFRYAPDKPRVKDVKLLTNWGDKSRTRNTLAYDFIREAGSVGHFAFPVRVQRNGGFHAILDMMEDADDRWLSRVGRDPNGALYKMYNSLNGAGGNEKKTRKHEGFADLQSLADNLSEARPLSARAVYAYDHVDLPQAVSYFAALALISSQDHGHKNYYLYRDTEGSGEWAIFPWDIDLSWGRNWTDSGGYFTDTLYQNNVLNFYNLAQQNKPSNRLYNLIFSHPDFRRMVLRRLRTVMDTILQPPGTPPAELRIEARVRELMDLLDPPEIAVSDADLDHTKWGSWGNRNPMRPEAQRIIDLHLPGRRSFLFNSDAAVLNGERIPPAQPARAALLMGALDFNPVSRNQQEEFVELLNPQEFALDISGWQLEGAVEFAFAPGTVVPGNGRIYVSPNVAAFRARANGPRGGQGLFVQGDYAGQLSARGATLRITDAAGRLVSETNYTGQPTPAQQFLRITELMFHPAPPPLGSPFTDQEFEFIELQNIGSGSLDLEGIRFTRGITFEFTGSAVTSLAAGEHVLLVKNLAAFMSRYGSGLNIAGTYAGLLDNSGETLRLEDAVGEVVFEFRYSPQWHPSASGQGYSMEWGKSGTSPGSPEYWRPSPQPGGSPGRDGSLPLAIRSAALVNHRLVITFHAEPGRTYRILQRTSVNTGDWQVEKTIRGSEAPEWLEVAIESAPGGESGFYVLSTE